MDHNVPRQRRDLERNGHEDGYVYGTVGGSALHSVWERLRGGPLGMGVRPCGLC